MTLSWLALWALAPAHATTLEVPGPVVATLAEAIANADPLGTTILLSPGTHEMPTGTVFNTTLQIVGQPGTVVVSGPSPFDVQNSSLVFEDLTLQAELVLSFTDLTLQSVRVETDGLLVAGGQIEADHVVSVGAFALGMPGMVATDLVVTDSEVSGSLDWESANCDIDRLLGCLTPASERLACGAGTVADSVISYQGASTTLDLAGAPTFLSTTFVSAKLDASATTSLELDRALFVGGVVALTGSSALTDTGNFVWGTDPGDLVATAAFPGFDEGVACTWASFATDPTFPAGITASSTPDPDGDGGSFWEDCSEGDPTIGPFATELPGDGIDQDCDGLDLCFLDDDGDGFGDPLEPFYVEDCVAFGYAGNSADCNDLEPTVYPDAPELCDGLDNDCGGLADDGLFTSLLCFDGDGDGYGTDDDRLALCAEPPDGSYVKRCGDCADDDPTRSPGVVDEPSNGIDEDCDGKDEKYVGQDLDGDGYCDSSFECEDPAVALPGDCDDVDPDVNPGIDEADFCDGVDRNCDGLPYTGFDLDGDGFPACGVCANSVVCDCNDATAQAVPDPDRDDVCDGIDNDCDGLVDGNLDGDGDGYFVSPQGCPLPGAEDCADDDDATFPGAFEDPADTVLPDCDTNCDGRCGIEDVQLDLDGDGYCIGGVVTDTPGVCDLAPDYPAVTYDCDDDNPAAFPRDGYDESVFDGVDNDCDGLVDEDSGEDFDEDGVVAGEDCNDHDDQIYPGALERCNGLDDNCDGALRDDEIDLDGDGWLRCPELRLGVPLPIDCDDEDAEVHPHQPEICGNGKEDDCIIGPGGQEDTDEDGDGWSSCNGDCNDADPDVRPNAVEICDLRDNDCNGLADEGFDRDADGAVLASECQLLLDFEVAFEDCDDFNGLRHYGLSEFCDGIDNDCDGLNDDEDDDIYADDDVDGVTQCDGDCDDDDPSTHPFAIEICDAVDHDCDGNEFTQGGSEAFDADLDGFRYCQGDCDDADDTVNPLGTDSCGVDGNCNTLLNEHAPDLDGDGYDGCDDCANNDASVSPGEPEVCFDGIDNDCDPMTEDGCPDTGATGVTGLTGDTAGMGTPTDETGDPLDTSLVDTGANKAAAGSELPPGWFCTTSSGGWSLGWVARR